MSAFDDLKLSDNDFLSDKLETIEDCFETDLYGPVSVVQFDHKEIFLLLLDGSKYFSIYDKEFHDWYYVNHRGIFIVTCDEADELEDTCQLILVSWAGQETVLYRGPFFESDRLLIESDGFVIAEDVEDDEGIEETLVQISLLNWQGEKQIVLYKGLFLGMTDDEKGLIVFVPYLETDSFLVNLISWDASSCKVLYKSEADNRLKKWFWRDDDYLVIDAFRKIIEISLIDYQITLLYTGDFNRFWEDFFVNDKYIILLRSYKYFRIPRGIAINSVEEFNKYLFYENTRGLCDFEETGLLITRHNPATKHDETIFVPYDTGKEIMLCKHDEN